MIIRYLYNSLIYLVIGNVWGLVLRPFCKQKSPLWVSKYRFEYTKNLLGAFLWLFLSISIGSLFLIVYPMGSIEIFIPTIFLVVGIMLLIGSTSLLEKMYIYPDKLEVRIGFQTTFRLLTSEILYVLRDKQSGSYAHIIYSDPFFGISGIGGGGEGDRMKIPSSLFQKGELNIDVDKLHPNLFEVFENIQKDLPNEPIVRNKNPLPMPQRLYFASILIINPCTVLIVSTILWGLLANLPIVLIALDFSNIFARLILKKMSSKDTLDWNYVKSHHK